MNKNELSLAVCISGQWAGSARVERVLIHPCLMLTGPSKCSVAMTIIMAAFATTSSTSQIRAGWGFSASVFDCSLHSSLLLYLWSNFKSLTLSYLVRINSYSCSSSFNTRFLLLLIGHMPGSSIVNLYVTIYSDFLISSEFTLIYCRNISCIRIMCVLPIYVIYLLGPFVFHLVDYLNCFFITTHPVIHHNLCYLSFLSSLHCCWGETETGSFYLYPAAILYNFV